MRMFQQSKSEGSVKHFFLISTAVGTIRMIVHKCEHKYVACYDAEWMRE